MAVSYPRVGALMRPRRLGVYSNGTGETAFFFAQYIHSTIMATKVCVQRGISNFNPEHFSSLITHAGFLLGLTNDEIKRKYSDYPISITTLYEEGEETNNTEITLEEEEAILSCLFNMKTMACDYVLIYFTKLVAPTDYINYLNSTYPYNYLSSSWDLPNGKAVVKNAIEGICVGIHRLHD